MSSDNGVTLKFFGDTKSAEAAIAKLESRLQSLENAQKQGNARVKASAQQAKEGMSGLGGISGEVASKFASMVGPLTLVYTAVNRISAEWQNVIDRQQKAGQSAVTFEQALGEATLNVGSVYGPEKLKSRALEMSAKTGVDPATAVSALSLAIKSGGATNEAEAERFAGAAVAAARLSPRSSPEKLAETAGSISDYMARKDATPEQAAGVLLSMQSKSNIKDANKGMEAFGPIMANMMAQGASEAMVQALGPALSQAISDKDGDITGTSTIGFTEGLNKAGASRFRGQKNIPDKMLALMNRAPETARAFFTGELEDLDTGKPLGKPELGRGRTETFFRAISGDKSLTGDPVVIQSMIDQYEKNKGLAISTEDAGKFYAQRLAQVQSATPTLQADRVLKSTAELNRLNGPEALRGVSRPGLIELLQSSGASDLSQKVAGWNFDLIGQEPLEQTQGELRQRVRDLREGTFWTRTKRMFAGDFDMSTGQLKPDRNTALNPVDERNAINMERAIESLGVIIQQQRQILERERPRNRHANIEATGY